jgi:GH24 family phage-related lysozyme (muramidase)
MFPFFQMPVEMPVIEPQEQVVKPAFADDSLQLKIAEHEGTILYPYQDTRGFWTIGTGHLLNPKNPTVLPDKYKQYSSNKMVGFEGNNTAPAMTKQEADLLFLTDYNKHKKEAAKFIEFNQLGPSGQAAMIDLVFNMGSKKLGGFKKMLEGIRTNNPDLVEKELIDSAYWKQAPNSRKQWVLESLKKGLEEKKGTPLL